MSVVRKFFDEKTKFVFLSSVVMMLIAHGFCFANLMYAHDSTWFYVFDGMDKVELGRWLYPVVVRWRLFATPWLMGVVSVLFASLAVVLVMKLLRFSKMQGVCVAIVFTTNITLTSLFGTYIYDADADCLALMLACFTVYAFVKLPPKINLPVAIVSLVGCLALYQTYMGVTIGLFLIVLVIESSKAVDWEGVWKAFLLGVKELLIIVLSMLLYVVGMNFAAKYYGVELSMGYNGAGRLGTMTIKDFLIQIPYAIHYYFEKLFKETAYNDSLVVAINFVMVVLLVTVFGLYVIKCKKFKGALTLIIPSMVLFPLGVNIIYVVSKGMMHDLMIFAFNLSYLLPFVFLNILNQKGKESGCIRKRGFYQTAVNLALVCIFVLGMHNVVYANGNYVYRKLVYDNSLLHAQTMWEDINSLEGYKEGETEVVFVGETGNSVVTYNSPVREQYYEITGGAASSYTYGDTINNFYNVILGRKMKIVNNIDLSNNEDVKNMPVYPTQGYCKMIGGRVVVKLSN